MAIADINKMIIACVNRTMSKAEKFIGDCTRTCSNELIAVESRAGKEVISYHEWLTPDQAREAVEIAKEETINEVCEWLYHHNDYICGSTDGIIRFDMDKLIEDLKKHSER